MRWLSGQGQRGPGAGWVQAPTSVELEIRAVWQEDEMPAEVTSAPGYQPFTLAPDSQEWVDSMVEVVDGGNAVYGRPKPVVPKTHRSLASTPSPVPTPAPQPRFTPPPAARVQPQPAKRRIVMPEIPATAPTPMRTLPPRIAMPDIGDESEPAPFDGPNVPAIGGTSTAALRPPRHELPEIGDPPQAPDSAHQSMPQIGGDDPPKKSKPRMPEIG